MAITEFATLQFISDDAPSTLIVGELLSRVNTDQSKWSGYPLFFYRSNTSPNTVYLISGWKSPEAHYEWIKSDENQELLRIFKPHLRNVEMVHLGIEFEEIREAKAGVLYHFKGEKQEIPEGEWNWVGEDVEGKVGGVFLFDDRKREGEVITKLDL